MTLKKTIRRVHLWLGLASGFVVLILGLTGCIYVFVDEIRSIVYHQRLFTEKYDTPAIPLDHLLAIAELELGNKDIVDFVELHGDKTRTIVFGTYTETELNHWHYFDRVSDYRKVYIDPYSGNVLKNENTEYEFFNLMLNIHWSLLLADRIGQNVVGVATLVFIIMLITGMVLWWPRNRKALKQRVWFRWKRASTWKRKNYDLHNILGFYVSSLAFIIAITGLMWAYQWINHGIIYLADIPERSYKQENLKPKITITDSNLPLESIKSQLKRRYSNFEVHYFGLDRCDNVVSVYSEVSNTMIEESSFDMNTGKLTEYHPWGNNSNGQKLSKLQYNIHVGKILGMPGKVLAFFSSLIITTLPITGFMIWWGRTFKKKKHRKKNNH